MGSAHHSEDEPSHDLLRQLEGVEENRRLLIERFERQIAGNAERTYSEGRLGEHDDGDIVFTMCHDDRVVHIDFGKQIRSLAMEPAFARKFGNGLIAHAELIETAKKEPS